MIEVGSYVKLNDDFCPTPGGYGKVLEIVDDIIVIVLWANGHTGVVELENLELS